MWDISCLPFQAAALGIYLLVMAGVMERGFCPVVVSCALLQAVQRRLTFFCTGLHSAETCWRVSSLVFLIQSRTVLEYVE